MDLGFSRTSESQLCMKGLFKFLLASPFALLSDQSNKIMWLRLRLMWEKTTNAVGSKVPHYLLAFTFSLTIHSLIPLSHRL